MLSYADQLFELEADMVMPEWVARKRGIDPSRHFRRVVELPLTVRARRAVPVPLVAFSKRDLGGVPLGRDRRSRWADQEAARVSLLREAVTLAVTRYLLDVPRDRWDYIGPKHPRRSPLGRRWMAGREMRKRYREMTEQVGAPDAEAWLLELAGVRLGGHYPVAVELDAGKVPPDLARRRLERWTGFGGLYSGLIWTSLVREHALAVAEELSRARVGADVYVPRPFLVLYLRNWHLEKATFEVIWEGALTQ